MEKLVIPAAIATAAGIGLDLMANMLSSYWPDAPHWLVGLLFWSGFLLAAVPLPVWMTIHFFRAGQKTAAALTGFVWVIVIAGIGSFFAIPTSALLALQVSDYSNPAAAALAALTTVWLVAYVHKWRDRLFTTYERWLTILARRPQLDVEFNPGVINECSLDEGKGWTQFRIKVENRRIKKTVRNCEGMIVSFWRNRTQRRCH
jgi:hypothetical protein